MIESVAAFSRCLTAGRNARLERRVGLVADDPALEAERFDSWRKGPAVDFPSHGQEGAREVDDRGPQDSLRSEGALILVGPEDERVGRLLHRLEHTECCGIGVVMEHVGTGPNQRNRRFTPGRDIVEGVEVRGATHDGWSNRLGTGNPGVLRLFDRRQLDPTDKTDAPGLGHATCHHARRDSWPRTAGK